MDRPSRRLRNLIAVNRWSTDAKGVVNRSELDLVAANGLRRVVLGAKAVFAQSAVSGRIAVLRADGAVGIYDAQVGKGGRPSRQGSARPDEDANVGDLRLALRRASS
jgi:hypothetical protein